MTLLKYIVGTGLMMGMLLVVHGVRAADPVEGAGIDRATLDQWSAPYRGWHYYPDPVIPSDLKIPGNEKFHSYDVPTVYQIPGDKKKWYMSFIGFNGQGYNSFVCESTNLINWTNPRLAMGFGKEGEFDFGGCVVGAYLYKSYDIKAPRLLKKRDGKYWTLYGCYARQGGYEIDPGYEGVATSEDGLTWTRAKKDPILSVHDKDCKEWEMHCIYQPWLVEHKKKFYNFYNAKHMPDWVEQMGGATSPDLLNWQRFTNNPVVAVRKGGYDEKFCSDGKVFRDGDHWVMFYFGVGKGGAHIMVAFSRDLVNWTAHPEPLYKAGGHPGGLDKQYAHKISLVYNKANETFYMYYCATGNKGRCIGLITSKPLVLPAKAGDADFPTQCAWGQPERHARKVAAVRSNQYDLVLIGDSITQNLEDGLDGESFAAVWDKHYAPRKAINLGYSGLQTRHILWNLLNGELDFKKSPRVAILLIGTNNTDSEHFFSNTFSGEQTFNGIKAIVDLIRKRHPATKVIIVRPYPCGVKGDETPFKRKYARLPKEAEELKKAGDLAMKLADNKSIFFIDVNKVFLRSDGKINTDLMPDLVHPNAAGAKAAAVALEPLLSKLMGDKPVLE